MRKTFVLISIALVLLTTGLFAGGGSEKAVPIQSSVMSLEKPVNWTEAQADKSFTYHISASNLGLSRWAVVTNNSIRVFSYLVFDPIINVDEEGNFIPWLAKSWEFASDGKSVKFSLRDDVYFTNGMKMTADDVVFTFLLLRDDTVNMPDSIAKGWRTYIEDAIKLDDYSFELKFKNPMPQFWVLISDPAHQVICKAAYLEMGHDAFWQKPVGTGAYIVESWDKANGLAKLRLRTDEHGYWAYKANNTWTNVKYITLGYSPEAQTRLASLRAGEVQMIDTIPTTEKETLEREGFTVTVMPPVNTVFLQTNSAPGRVFDNQKLREALSLAIDRDLVVDALLSGFGIPIKWPAGPGYLGYEDKEAIVYDKDKAIKLVAESGYKGEPIDFIYTTVTVNIGNELTQAIQSMAKEVGINLRIRPLESAVYNEARTKADFDLVLAAIGNDKNMWWKIGAEVIGNDRFKTGFQNQKLKELGRALQVTNNQVEMDRIFKQIYEIETAEFAPNIYLYWPTIVNAWAPNVKNVLLHNTQYPDLSSLILL